MANEQQQARFGVVRCPAQPSDFNCGIYVIMNSQSLVRNYITGNTSGNVTFFSQAEVKQKRTDLLAFFGHREFPTSPNNINQAWQAQTSGTIINQRWESLSRAAINRQEKPTLVGLKLKPRAALRKKKHENA